MISLLLQLLRGSDAVVNQRRTGIFLFAVAAFVLLGASSPVLASQHMVTNVQAFPEDGGGIRANAYFSATIVDPDGARTVIGRYSDSIREDSDELRLAHKRIHIVATLQLSPAIG